MKQKKLNKGTVKIKLSIIAFISIVLFTSSINKQTKRNENIETEKLVCAMNSMRNYVRESLSELNDNKLMLVINETDNMLTNIKCFEWLDYKGDVILEKFSGIDECSEDSTYISYYVNGVIDQGEELFFVGQFQTKELRSGMAKEQVKKVLGMPYKENSSLMVYKKKLHPEIAGLEGSEFDESVVLLFDDNKLIAVWVKFYVIC